MAIDKEMLDALKAVVQEELADIRIDIRAIKLDIENHVKPDIKAIGESQLAANRRLDSLEKKIEDISVDIKARDTILGATVHQLQQSGYIHLADPIER